MPSPRDIIATEIETILSVANLELLAATDSHDAYSEGMSDAVLSVLDAAGWMVVRRVSTTTIATAILATFTPPSRTGDEWVELSEIADAAARAVENLLTKETT